MLRVDNLQTYEKLSPTEKLLTIVFAVAAKDNADELRFDFRPNPPEFRLWYWVEDELVELVPPPAAVWPDIYEILLSHTKPAPGQVPPSAPKGKRRVPFPSFPFAGKLPITFGKKKAEFDILFFRGRTGEHIWIEKPSELDVSEAGSAFFAEWKSVQGNGKVKRPRKR